MRIRARSCADARRKTQVIAKIELMRLCVKPQMKQYDRQYCPIEEKYGKPLAGSWAGIAHALP